MVDRKKQVFISYSSEDRPYADHIRTALLALGLEVWMDSDAILAGDRIASKIEDGLRGSDYFLLLISEASNNSIWVKREISRAFDLAQKKHLTLVPVLMRKKEEVPFEFRGLVYIDGSRFETGVDRLLEFFPCPTVASQHAGTSRNDPESYRM
jgi:hypothetical protein